MKLISAFWSKIAIVSHVNETKMNCATVRQGVRSDDYSVIRSIGNRLDLRPITVKMTSDWSQCRCHEI